MHWHGTTKVIIMDQGSKFRGEQLEQWHQENNIEHDQTFGYYLQFNGKTERAKGTIW